MSNRIILWGVFVVPWLTLFFMKKEDIKRFLPVSILAALVALVVNEIGMSYNWWGLKVITFPLQRFYPHFIGLFPVVTMWIFYFTYKKFLLFMAVELITNSAFSYLYIGYFLTARGISYINQSTLLFFMAEITGIALYGYQIWLESMFKHPYRESEK